MVSNIKSDSFLFKFLSILCAMIVPLLVTGPFLPDLLLSSMSLWFIYYTIKNNLYKIYKNSYFLLFIFFCTICILSSILSENIFLSLKSSLFYFRIGVFALLISFLIEQHNKILNYFYLSFLITFSSLIVDGYFQYFTSFNLIGWQISGMRVSSFFGDELILGSYLSRLFPLFFALFVFRDGKKPIEIIFVSILFILIDVLIFLAGERASFFLLNLSTFFIILFISQYKLLRLSIFIVSFFIIAFILINDPKLYNRYIASPINSMGLDGSEKTIFTKAHDTLIKGAYKMFLDKPLLGHGPKMFREKCSDPKYTSKDFKCHPHPHNFYAQLLAETGFVGFSFLFGLLLYFIYLMFKHLLIYIKYREKWLSDYQICLLAGLLITIWPFTTTGSFFTNKLMLFYSLQMGFFKIQKK